MPSPTKVRCVLAFLAELQATAAAASTPAWGGDPSPRGLLARRGASGAGEAAPASPASFADVLHRKGGKALDEYTRTIQILQDSLNKDTRLDAARLLGRRFCGIEAVPALSRVLENDDSSHVREEAAYALGRIGSYQGSGDKRGERTERRGFAMQALINAVRPDKSARSDWKVDGAVVTALGRIGDTRAAPALRRLLQLCDSENDDNEREVLAKAVEALGKIGDREAVPGLQKVLEQHRSLAENGGVDECIGGKVVRALGKIGAREARKVLRQVLQSSEYQNLHALAARELGHMPGAGAQTVSALAKALEKHKAQGSVGEAAIDALSAIALSTPSVTDATKDQARNALQKQGVAVRAPTEAPPPLFPLKRMDTTSSVGSDDDTDLDNLLF